MGEIVHSGHRDMPAPNLETVRVFWDCRYFYTAGSYSLSQGPLFYKSTCPRHGFAGPEMLARFHLLLGSTSRYLPALAYASDRHVAEVISVMSRQSCVPVLSAVCLSLKLYIRTFTGNLSRL